MADNVNEILAAVGNTSDETEFYSPMPEGYVPGRTKYVVVVAVLGGCLGCALLLNGTIDWWRGR